MSSASLMTWLDRRFLLDNGATISPPLDEGPRPPRRTGAEIAMELSGRKLLRFMLPHQVDNAGKGTTKTTYVTPTPYAPADALTWLVLPRATALRTHVAILDPSKLSNIIGPLLVAGHAGIQYILESGYSQEAIVVPGAPGAPGSFRSARKRVAPMSSIDFELTEGGINRQLHNIFSWDSERHNYRPVVMGADRHGSLIWEAAKNGDIMRYVTLSVTPTPGEAIFEAWVVASEGEQFVRRDVGTATVGERELHFYVNKENDSGVVEMVDRAFSIAKHLQREDMHESLRLRTELTLPENEDDTGAAGLSAGAL